jgi:putative glycosyltransferase
MQGYFEASGAKSDMRLSVVTTLYQSAPYVSEFFGRISKVAEKISDDCEFIFVNDGSLDHSLDLALKLRERDNRITVVDLSRNFGHHRALMVGLGFATGDLVFLIDVDLEEDPELLRVFYKRFEESHADSIYGVQSRRKGGPFERVSGALFYKVLNWLSGYDMPSNTLIARLMTRRFVDSLLLYKEQEIDIDSLVYMTGFRQVPVVVKKHAKDETTYTMGLKLGLALRSITAFSRRPLIAIFVLGVLIILLTAGVIAYYLTSYFVSGRVPSGFTAIVLSIWLLGGLSIFGTGLVALYIAIIFNEVKSRPSAIIKDVYEARGYDVVLPNKKSI